MIKKLLLLVLVVLICVMGYAATKPDDFKYSRSISIDAPVSRIYPYVNDLRQWPLWSPFEKTDPKMKKTLSGPPEGVGAVAEWEGNMQAGAGRMEITKASPDSAISMTLEMLKPMKATNQVEFTFVPKGQSTQVTWTMSGKNPFIGKVFSVFVDCEKMVGAQFEEGLSSLKTVAEASSRGK